MDLWIKTQKTDLFKVNNVQVLGCDIYTYINDGNYTLGEYDSRGRAIDVMCEIQKLLMASPYMSNIDFEIQKMQKCEAIIIPNETHYIERSTIVYEMPQE